MTAKLMKTAMNIGAISDQLRTQRLTRKFLESHVELTSKDDFEGFLIAEPGLETRRDAAGLERPGIDV